MDPSLGTQQKDPSVQESTDLGSIVNWDVIWGGLGRAGGSEVRASFHPLFPLPQWSELQSQPLDPLDFALGSAHGPLAFSFVSLFPCQYHLGLACSQQVLPLRVTVTKQKTQRWDPGS